MHVREATYNLSEVLEYLQDYIKNNGDREVCIVPQEMLFNFEVPVNSMLQYLSEYDPEDILANINLIVKATKQDTKTVEERNTSYFNFEGIESGPVIQKANILDSLNWQSEVLDLGNTQDKQYYLIKFNLRDQYRVNIALICKYDPEELDINENYDILIKKYELGAEGKTIYENAVYDIQDDVYLSDIVNDMIRCFVIKHQDKSY